MSIKVDLVEESSYTIQITDKEFSLLTKGLAYLALPEKFPPKGTQKEDAWALNKLLIERRRHSINAKMKVCEDALNKILEIEEEQRKESEAMHSNVEKTS